MKELYDSRTPKKETNKEPKTKKDDKLTKLLNSLSEEERKKLKELL